MKEIHNHKIKNSYVEIMTGSKTNVVFVPYK